MDLSILPDDTVHYISTFIDIISWRSELHYSILLSFYQKCRFQDIPSHIKTTITEEQNSYLYLHQCNIYFTRAFKHDPHSIRLMERTYLSRYLNPLRDYLNDYRRQIIYRAWHHSIKIFGIHMNISPSIYSLILCQQGYKEGVCSPEWKGCVPLEEYKQFISSKMIHSI
jgi:hypothetical protein